MKITGLIFFVSFLISPFAYAQEYNPKTLVYKLDGYKAKKAILYSYRGSTYKAVDTADIQASGAFVFFNIEKYKPGIYSVRLSDSVYTELVFNNEDIVFQANVSNILLTAKVQKSVENTIYFDYWKFVQPIRDSLNYFNIVSQKLEKIPNSNLAQVQKVKSEITRLRIKIMTYIQSKRDAYPEALSPALLRAYQIPYYDIYLADSSNNPYQNEFDYYFSHFFDNIDFSDARLLNTKVIYNSINDFIKTFGEPASTLNYMSIVDNILRSANKNSEIYDFTVHAFLQNFDNSIWEDVFVYIVDRYYKETYSRHPEVGLYYFNTADRIKMLKPGMPIKNVIMSDSSGNQVDIRNIKAKAKLIIFYSSDCPHCDEAMPSLIESHKKYASLGLKTIAIAIDDDVAVWKSGIKAKNVDWIFISDLKGLLSPVMEDFHIYQTPTLFIVDENNIIVSKPNGPVQINTTLDDLLVP